MRFGLPASLRRPAWSFLGLLVAYFAFPADWVPPRSDW